MADFLDTPPSDAEVLEALANRTMSPETLLQALEAKGYNESACQKAVRRCLNRGSIRLAADFTLEVAPGVLLAA